jgi:hypothetical protein
MQRYSAVEYQLARKISDLDAIHTIDRIYSFDENGGFDYKSDSKMRN